MMATVSSALVQQVFRSDVKCKAMTWNEHLEFRHVPHRRNRSAPRTLAAMSPTSMCERSVGGGVVD